MKNQWCFVTLVMSLLTSPIHAAIILVESGGCTLRDAIRSANADASRGDCNGGNGADTIITPDVWFDTISSTLPTINTDLTIRTLTEAGQLVISGDEQHRIMRISGVNTDVTLTRVRLTAGMRPSAISDGGGAIRITDASVTLNEVEITDNYALAVNGAGVYIDDGELTINNSVFFGNILEFGESPFEIHGAGLYANDSLVTINDSRFFGNLFSWNNPAGSSMYIKGGQLDLNRSLIDEEQDGVLADGAIVNITNTTFSRSQIHQTAYNTELLYVRNNSTLRMNHVTFGSYGWIAYDSTIDVTNSILKRCFVTNSTWLRDLNNLRLDDDCIGNRDEGIVLAGLTDNGGPTKTHALGFQSVAINSGAAAHCLPVDQRSEPRGVACDIGAYEVTDIADVEVSLHAVTPLPWGTGQNIQVNLILKNNGPGLATWLDLEEIVSGMIITDVGSFVCPALPCVYPFIASGSQVIIPIYGTMNLLPGSNYALTVEAVETINSLHHDPIVANNEASLSGTIVAASDLAISKTLTTSPPFFVGQSIEYNIQVNNLNGLTATGVEVKEIPVNLTINNMSGCNNVLGLVCQINSVSSNFPANITVTATVDADFFDNAAVVSANEYDPITINNTDNTFNGGATSTAELSVNMVLLTDGPHHSDQFVQYQVVIKSDLEPATDLVLDSTYQGIYIGITGCNFLPCEFPFIAPESQIVLTFSMFAPQMIPGLLENATHSVSISAGQSDPFLSNNTASITTSLISAVDLKTSLNLVTEPPYYRGQDVQYSLEIRNRGLNNVDAVDVSLSDIQNMQIDWVSSFNCSNLPCTIPALDFDQSEYIQFNAKLLNVGAFDVSATASSFEYDPLPGDNTDNSNNGGVAEALLDDLIFADDFEFN